MVKDIKIIHHRNEWNWGKSIICVTDDGRGVATVSFVTDYEFDEAVEKFNKVDQAIISGMSVHILCRRQGYGNLLLDECENEAAKHGYTEVYLWADPKSIAHEWYLRHGYEDMPELNIIPTGDNLEKSEALVRMKKNILALRQKKKYI